MSFNEVAMKLEMDVGISAQFEAHIQEKNRKSIVKRFKNNHSNWH